MKKKIIAGFGWTFILEKIVFLVQFFGGIVLARILLPADFGRVAFITSVILLVFILKGLGFDTYAIQCSRRNFKEYVGTAFSINLFLNFVLFTAAFVMALIVSSGSALLMFIVLLITRVFSEILFFHPALLQKELLYKKLAFLNTFSSISSISVSVVLAVYGFGVWSLVIGIVIGDLLRIILGILWTPYFIRPRFSKRGVKDILNFGKYSLLADAMGKLYGRSDKIILERVTGVASLGFYNRAHSLLGMTNNLAFNSLTSVAAPLFSRFKNNRQRLSKIYNQFLAISIRINIGLYLVLGCVVADFIVVLYTTKWLPAVPIFRAILLFAIISPLLGFTRRFHLNIGKPKAVGIAHVILFTALLVIIFPCVYLWGGVGVALALNISVVLAFIFLMLRTRKFIDIKWERIFITPILLAILIALFYAFIIKMFVFDSAWLRLLVHSAIISAFYLLGLLIFERKYVLQIVQEIKGIYKRDI
tara:strand:+ start:5618 stop:7045 length:1428 start_codon:yes stop_codon:yes gene_type:complete